MLIEKVILTSRLSSTWLFFSYYLFFLILVWFGTRHFVTFMLFLGMANAYVMRTNMSVAIVAMVNHTAIGADSDDTAEGVDEECGVDSTNSVSLLFVLF